VAERDKVRLVVGNVLRERGLSVLLEPVDQADLLPCYIVLDLGRSLLARRPVGEGAPTGQVRVFTAAYPPLDKSCGKMPFP